jgi:sulfite exporter TauE/SafE
MSSRGQKSRIDPVILIALGIGLLTFAIILLTLQNQIESGVAIGTSTSSAGQIFIAFITGLTTGGLSCLAVQGGLLASSMAHQIEQDYLEQSVGQKTRGKKYQEIQVKPSNTALPIFLFLVAKLVAYTFLGALLGWLGSFFTLSPTYRAVLMIAIGIFMIGNALRMFNVHPIFRYFSIEPPKFITRYIRKTAKGTDTFTPVFLGALTVFIPCSVTQAMMATALSTGSVILGAALMFAFTLGTSPVFFIVAYMTAEIGARLEKFFMRFVAVIVLILGFVTLDGGLNLMGSPMSFQNLTRNLITTNSSPPQSTNAPQSSITGEELFLNVENSGYFPSTLKAPAGKDLKLNLVTKGTYSCALDFLIPVLNFSQMLPPSGNVQVDIPAQEKGSTLYFTCSMGMYTGRIVFE